MKRRTFACGLFSALSSVPTIGFCESELEKWQNVQREVQQYAQLQEQFLNAALEARQQQLDAEFEMAKMWTEVNPLLPTNFMEWLAQYARFNGHLFNTVKEIDPIWSPELTTTFFNNYFEGTVIYYPKWVERVLRIYESNAVSYLSDGLYATLCPKSQWLKLPTNKRPALEWTMNSDLFDMWKYQKQTKKLLTEEFVAKKYLPSCAEYATVVTLPLVARGGEHLARKAYQEYRISLQNDPMAQAKGQKPMAYYDWTNQSDDFPHIAWALNNKQMARFNAERQKLGPQLIDEIKEKVIRYATFKDDELKLPKKFLDYVNS